MAHRRTPAGLADDARVVVECGATSVYVVDSTGSLVLDEVGERVAAVAATVPRGVAVGFHAHQNLSLGVANALWAVRHGATHLDASTRALGAGAGNAPTEALVAACAHLGITTGIDPLAMFDVAEEVVRPVMGAECVVNRANLLVAFAGLPSSFVRSALLHAAHFGVSATELLVACGKRGLGRGQEGAVADVARELADARS